MKDKIYSQPQKKIPPFCFDKQVTRVFDNMIRRSVPGYLDIVRMIGVLAARYVRPKTRVYDLGCSLGAVSKIILQSVPNPNYELIAVDASPEMMQCAEKNLRAFKKTKINLLCDKLENIQIQRASMVVLNFVLQFIPRSQRLLVLKKIYRGMEKSGVLIFSEKIDFETLHEKNFQQRLHESFKKIQGYSELEISQKRAALERVLIPESFRVHERRLKQAGFSEVYVWFRCFNFMSIVAIKAL